ncbi:PepSY-associated TM helix domain-containing protein [Actinoplanes aureus]|uniref:PepSY domain-containing protein n=1 Tax=Actinoplanes aureus TaxID=2792083 RepID=A0A931CJA4_9ACTN|nr:PepSY domain-containing protein [Actinoplanes aureus]MBG0567213.1 PepSY domain-containing protein [Actinoplanes aureus]
MSVTPELADPLAETAPTRPARRASGFAALLLRLHFYAGVLVAPFLVVAAVTGLLYTVTPQLDAALYGDKLTVAEAGSTALPLADQIAAARAAHPDGTLAAVQPGTGDQTTRVVFSQPGLGENQHTVYVDPYTGDVQGQLTTWWGSTPVTTWLDDLHRNLHLGDLGRHYSELAASWLWVLALGGIVLWWRRRRSVRGMLTPDLAAKKGVRRTRGWHAATGAWLAVGLLILSATGLTWSRYAGASFTTALDTLDAHRPALDVPGAAASAGGHHGAGGDTPTTVDPAEADTVLRVARDNGLTGPVELTLPESGGQAWTVAGVDNTWPVGLDRVAVDPAAATVVARSDFADWPLLAQLSKLGVQAHMGVLFGPANQILLAALAVGLLCVIVWGYRMWWQRRPTRGDRRAPVGAAPARGGWLGLPGWAIMAGVPVVFALGWAMPLLGVPLLAFLVVDVVAGAVSRRRAGAPR